MTDPTAGILALRSRADRLAAVDAALLANFAAGRRGDRLLRRYAHALVSRVIEMPPTERDTLAGYRAFYSPRLCNLAARRVIALFGVKAHGRTAVWHGLRWTDGAPDRVWIEETIKREDDRRYGL